MPAETACLRLSLTARPRACSAGLLSPPVISPDIFTFAARDICFFKVLDVNFLDKTRKEHRIHTQLYRARQNVLPLQPVEEEDKMGKGSGKGFQNPCPASS